jgi:hypothetical protein
MVAGLTASYEGFNYVTSLESMLDSLPNRVSDGASRERIASAARTLDTALSRIAVSGFGIVHRDLGRRYSDQFIADAMPTPSIVAGVDGPCRQLDATIEALRKLQGSTISDVNAVLAHASVGALPSWKTPAAPACGAR